MKKSLFSIVMTLILIMSILPVYGLDAVKIPTRENISFTSITGIVSEVIETDTTKKVSLVENDEIVGNITINDSTFILDGKSISIGDRLTCYTDSSRPVIYIYPPQYIADIVVVNDGNKSTYAGSFDNKFLSDDKGLILNLSENTKIVSLQGDDFIGEIVGRNVLVEYSMSTKSIPAQTTPERIIVLELDNTGDEIIPSFNKVEGVIKQIRDNEFDNSIKYFDIEIFDDVYAVFVISENTYVVDKDLKVGDKVEGFYDSTRPMIAIYPPQYTIEVLKKQTNEGNTFVGVFNKDYVDTNNSLKLNIDKSVQIVDLDNKTYRGSLIDKKLAVFYTVSTRSIPAQTTPIKIVLLESTEKSVFINGVEVGKSYIKNDSVMLPLRAVMENMGYVVDWVGSTMSININGTHSISINSLKCVNPNLVDIVLNENPEIINGSTYISIDYFKSFCNFVIEDATTINLNAGRCATPNFDEFYLNEPQQ